MDKRQRIMSTMQCVAMPEVVTHAVAEFIQEIPGRVQLHHGSGDCFLRRLRESHSTSTRNLPSLSGAKVYKTEDCERRASSLVQNS